jgi:hypothetical protein
MPMCRCSWGFKSVERLAHKPGAHQLPIEDASAGRRRLVVTPTSATCSSSIAPAAAPDVQVALRVAADIGEAQTGDRAFDQHARERALGRDAAGSPGSNPVFGRRPSGLVTMGPRFPF